MLNIQYNGSIFNLTGIPMYLCGIDHHATPITISTGSQPRQQSAVDTIVDEYEDIKPFLVRDEVPDQSAAGAREQALVCCLKLVKKDSFSSVTPMRMAENMKQGLDTPDLAQKVRTSLIEITVVLLGMDQQETVKEGELRDLTGGQ